MSALFHTQPADSGFVAAPVTPGTSVITSREATSFGELRLIGSASRNSCSRRSDHSPFWNEGYAAILGSEDNAEDFNAYYHTADDRRQFLNLPYFTNFVRATVGTAATWPSSPAGRSCGAPTFGVGEESNGVLLTAALELESTQDQRRLRRSQTDRFSVGRLCLHFPILGEQALGEGQPCLVPVRTDLESAASSCLGLPKGPRQE